MSAIRRRLHNLYEDESGQTAVAIVLVFIGVFAIAALALDAGFWFFDHRRAQNQAEAAAHAAAQEMPNETAALTTAQAWLNQNGADITLVESANCDGMASNEARIVFPDPETARVCLRRDSLVLLSRLSLVTNARVSASAAARVYYEPLTYALMAMNPDGCTGSGDGLRSLNFAGNGRVNLLDDGSTYVRSTCDGAMYIDGNNVIVNAEGSHDVMGLCAPSARCLGSQVNPDPTNNYSEYLEDPFASYPQPTPGTCRTGNGFTGASSATPVVFTSGSTTLAAGTYCQPLQVSSAATVRLGAGTHIFRRGVMVSGNTSKLLSNGNTLLYFTCATGNSCGGTQAPPSVQSLGCSDPATFCLQGGSGSEVNVNGPDDLPGIVIWIDRTAGPASSVNNRTMVRIAGQGSLTIDGNVYSITSTVTLQGQGAGQNVSVTGTIVGDKITFTGQATYNVTWDVDLAPRTTDYAIVE